MKDYNAIAKKQLSSMSLKDLVEQFELTTNMKDKNIFTVRGWLMDAIEEKNPEGFAAWLEIDYPEDNELRVYVLAQ